PLDQRSEDRADDLLARVEEDVLQPEFLAAEFLLSDPQNAGKRGGGKAGPEPVGGRGEGLVARIGLDPGVEIHFPEMERQRREVERPPRGDRFEREAAGREDESAVLLPARDALLAAVAGAFVGRFAG